MAIERDRVLVLRRFPFGESSLVVHALSRDHGRLHLLAKGAYRPTSRYCGVLDLFDTLELEWSRPRGHELAQLRAGALRERRHRIAADLARYRAALCVLELAELGAQEGQPSPGLFDLTRGALDRLVPGRIADPVLALVLFELGFLQELGLAPALVKCAACGGPAPAFAEGGEQRATFSAGSGGRLCGPCAREARAAGRRVGTLPAEVLEQAERLAAQGERAARDLTPAELRRVRDFVVRFLEYHLQTRPKSYRAAQPSAGAARRARKSS